MRTKQRQTISRYANRLQSTRSVCLDKPDVRRVTFTEARYPQGMPGVLAQTVCIVLKSFLSHGQRSRPTPIGHCHSKKRPGPNKGPVEPLMNEMKRGRKKQDDGKISIGLMKSFVIHLMSLGKSNQERMRLEAI